MKSIAIIGLGLIGGSIAKAVKQNSDVFVVGWNRNESVAESALEQKAIDKIWDKKSVLESELIILALPPAATVEFLRKNAGFIKKDTVVTDVCGIKAQIVYKCEKICKQNRLFFIGGHPMAGKEKGSFINSDAALFEGASYILTPTENTCETAKKAMTELTKIIKAKNITLASPKQHDRVIAFTSQLPHVLAGAYVKSPLCSERKGFSAGSFIDVSRVATADEKLWSELFLANKENLCTEIETLIKNLSAYCDAIKKENKNELAELIKQGREIKEKDIK